ncbi:uncharacterized protein LOC104895616 [Beta vulgaris subsp. vulgaris]|uniref:uncharacterized protein LOC104895616 n=1 Tax=Beta vulgaris subsp. vulgaris TaxID=3555 RepID=UPI0005402ACE|nr:uncharacterized protein LOC104895616 [Beta vulgaris subsp. vulgaris]
MEEIDAKIIQSVWRSSDIDWSFSPSIGSSGGLLSIWDTTQFEVTDRLVNRYWISLKGTFLSINFECVLINIYNPCTPSAREGVWAEIFDHWKANPKPFLIAGDFNDILSSTERGSSQVSQCSIDNFQKFVQDLQLMEIASSTRGFTWFRRNSKSLLDRLFVNPEWLTTFPSLNVSLLQRGLSDHCPLLILSKDKNWGPKPFRFQNCWLTDPRCLKIIKEAWSNSASLPICDKLKATKSNLKKWNHEEFGNIDFMIAKLEASIQNFDTIANERDLDEDELNRRQAEQSELWTWMKRREVYWAQNSRIRWLKDGDRNTKFFHTIATHKRRKNTIASIEVEGRLIEEPEKINRKQELSLKRYSQKKV